MHQDQVPQAAAADHGHVEQAVVGAGVRRHLQVQVADAPDVGQQDGVALELVDRLLLVLDEDAHLVQVQGVADARAQVGEDAEQVLQPPRRVLDHLGRVADGRHQEEVPVAARAGSPRRSPARARRGWRRSPCPAARAGRGPGPPRWPCPRGPPPPAPCRRCGPGPRPPRPRCRRRRRSRSGRSRRRPPPATSPRRRPGRRSPAPSRPGRAPRMRRAGAGPGAAPGPGPPRG